MGEREGMANFALALRDSPQRCPLAMTGLDDSASTIQNPILFSDCPAILILPRTLLGALLSLMTLRVQDRYRYPWCW